MLSNHLDYDEQKTLEAILRFHDIDIDADPKLVKDLATFCNWTREDEKSKSALHSSQPPFLLCLLSLMGIYGKNALPPAR